MAPPSTPPTQPIEQYFDLDYHKALREGLNAVQAYLAAANKAGWRLMTVELGYVIFERTFIPPTPPGGELALYTAALRMIANLDLNNPASTRVNLEAAVVAARTALGLPNAETKRRLEESRDPVV
jgi:hypothetical protein